MSETRRPDRNLDLSALIRQALDDKPPADLPDRVLAKLALVTTAVELVRLATEATLTSLFQADTDHLETKREDRLQGDGPTEQPGTK